MLKQNDEYECHHLEGERLRVVRRYNDNQFVGKSDKTEREFMIGVNHFTEPHLCLAHVSDAHCELRKVQRSLI